MEGGSLAERLRAAGHIDAEQIRLAELEQGRYGSFEEALVRLGFIDEAGLMRAVCRVTHTPAVDLAAKTIEPEVLALVSPELVHKHRCLPLFLSSSHARVPGRGATRHVLFLGLENPLAAAPVAEVGRTTGLDVRPVVVGPVQLTLAIERFYPPSTRDSAAMDANPLIAGDTSPLEATPLEEQPWAEAVPEVAAPEAVVAEALPAEETDGDEDDGRRRDTPTRIILQALTKLLVANGVIDRSELMAEVAAIRESERADPARSDD